MEHFERQTNDSADESAVLREILQRLEAIEESVQETSVIYWSHKDIARHIGRTTRYVAENLATERGFPKAIRLPTDRGRSRPLYRKAEVISWLDRQR